MPKSSSMIAAQSSLYKTGEFARTFPVAIETSSRYVSFHIGTNAYSDCRESRVPEALEPRKSVPESISGYFPNELWRI